LSRPLRVDLDKIVLVDKSLKQLQRVDVQIGFFVHQVKAGIPCKVICDFLAGSAPLFLTVTGI